MSAAVKKKEFQFLCLELRNDVQLPRRGSCKADSELYSVYLTNFMDAAATILSKWCAANSVYIDHRLRIQVQNETQGIGVFSLSSIPQDAICTPNLFIMVQGGCSFVFLFSS